MQIAHHIRVNYGHNYVSCLNHAEQYDPIPFEIRSAITHFCLQQNRHLNTLSLFYGFYLSIDQHTYDSDGGGGVWRTLLYVHDGVVII